MKRRMRGFMGLVAGVCLFSGTAAVLPSCTRTQPQQRITYNTLFSVEQTTLATYDGYLDLVLSGQVKTNGVPAVSRAFNEFQLALGAAAELANHATNALAPQSVLDAAARVARVIAVEKEEKKYK